MNAITTSAPEPLEILDVLWRIDPDTRERAPVIRDDAVERLRASHQNRAASEVERLPHHGGVISADAIDQVFLAVHFELARLSEYLHVPHRMASVLRPLVQGVREAAGDGVVQVIDVGCGIGLDMRALAAHQALGPGVEYVGIDFNSLLVDAARRLARDEHIAARFVVGDAFEVRAAITHPERTVMVSQGVLHHLGRDRLPEFFAQHGELSVAAFAHLDVSPGFWSTFGGWVLHQVRMRHPVSRHDGTMSMKRALDSDSLLSLAREGLGTTYDLTCESRRSLMPAPHEALRPITGVLR